MSNKVKDKKFEKRRKGVETILDIIFWIYLISLILEIIVGSFNGIIMNAVATILLFFSARLAHRGHIAAGIIGIIIAIFEIILAGILWKVLGVLLGIDSILYLIYYKDKK